MIVPVLTIFVYLQQIIADEGENVPKRDIVTVCNSTYCDDLKPITWCSNPTELQVYVTSESGDRFRHFVTDFEDTGENSDADFTITIDPCKEYRKIVGFGGAMTDATALMISCLSENTRKKLLNSYFHCETGIGYYLLRIPLGGCDFSLRNYTYCDSDKPDPRLTKFKLNEMDLKYKIPIIKEAQTISCRTLSFKGATWYAPSWMTSEKTAKMAEVFSEALPPELQFITNFIPPKWETFTQKSVTEAYERIYAQYLAKTLTEFQRFGVFIKYLSPGNEPQLGTLSNRWPRDRYQNWVTNILCPTLKECGHDSVDLLAVDDQTIYVPYWQEIFEDNYTRSCFKGLATHWYYDYIPFLVESIQDEFCEKYPELILLPTESSVCEEDLNYFFTNDWEKAVRYAKDIILKLLHCGQGYIDWNMALDFRGGPNWIENYCYAAVAVNCTADEFHKRVLFYVLGHFSKFLPEGSVRVNTATSSNEQGDSMLENLDVVAFKVESQGCSNPNIVFIALNTNENDVTADICFLKGKCTRVKVPKNSIISAVTSLI